MDFYFKFQERGFSKIKSCELAEFSESSRYNMKDMWAKGSYNSLIPLYGGWHKFKLSVKQLFFSVILELILNGC